MPQKTTHYDLNIYEPIADIGESFLDFREEIAGVGATTNMKIIDGALKVIQDDADTALSERVQSSSLSTDNSLVVFDGTGGLTIKQGVAPGTNGQVLMSNGTVWESADLPALPTTKTRWIDNFKPMLTAGCGASSQIEMGTNKNVYDILPFDPNVNEYAYVNIGMPEDWDGNPVSFYIYWTHPATTTNFGVRWGMWGVSLNNANNLDSAITGSVQHTLDTGGSTHHLYISSLISNMTFNGSPEAGELAHIRIYRNGINAGDNLAVDAYLIGAMMIYGVE